MKRVALLLLLLLLAPLAEAHHPGSNQGLSRYEPLTANLVHRLPDVQSSFEEWDAMYPDLVDRQVTGTTGVLNLPLETIRITDESVPFDNATNPTGNKLRIYLDGGHHGNEFLGVDLVMYYLEEVLNRAGEPETAAFLQEHELWATPLVNPEGNLLDTRKNANQVDVNRNYGYEWGGPGSDAEIWSFNYRGEAPFSEPEVLANAEFARSIMPDLWITMHTGVAEFYWPWGWTYDKAPDWEFFESLEAPFEAATNGRIDAMMAAELYLAAGATDDWGYGQLGVPTHTYEVHEDAFVPVYGLGVPSEIQDQLNGLDWLVRNTYSMGAMLVPHQMGPNFHISNNGWGRAENVTVSWPGGGTVIDRVAPGQMIEFNPAPAGEFTVEWSQLLIHAPEAKTRTAAFVMEDFGAEADAVPTPAPALILAVALAVFAAIRRR